MGIRAYIGEWRARRPFPKGKKDFWYCGEMITYKSELRKKQLPWRIEEMGLPCDRFIINPYSESGGKVPKKGDIIPCIKLNGWIGFYLVTKDGMYSSAGSDFAMWDNGHSIDLEFHHCEKEVVVM